MGLNRSTLYYIGRGNRNDEALRIRLKELAAQYKRWGCPMLHHVLRREGFVMNHKRTWRIYKEEKLGLKRHRRKRHLPSDLRKNMPAPTRPNELWAMDFIIDRLQDGRRLKIFTLIDEFNKRCLAMEIDTSISSERVARILQEVASRVGYPKAIRSDNGPEFTSKALFNWRRDNGVEPLFIDPGKPTQNAFAESFHGRFREECLNENWFVALDEARQICADWRLMYNSFRPHTSLGRLTPDEFTKKYYAVANNATTAVFKEQMSSDIKLLTGT